MPHSITTLLIIVAFYCHELFVWITLHLSAYGSIILMSYNLPQITFRYCLSLHKNNSRHWTCMKRKPSACSKRKSERVSTCFGQQSLKHRHRKEKVQYKRYLKHIVNIETVALIDHTVYCQQVLIKP